MKKIDTGKIICFVVFFMLLSIGISGFFSNDTVKADQKNLLLGRTINQLCGLVEPDEWWKDAHFTLFDGSYSLPLSWDWRENNGVTSIKDQGDCGSCWAFATVAPLEHLIKIKTGFEVDLSEQWLVSCNRDGWGCDGGWWAHDYHQYKKGLCGGTGAVYEKDFPYIGYDQYCRICNHHYLIDGWFYVGSIEGVPETDAIKQAIYEYGSVSSSVIATDDWEYYNGTYIYENNDNGQINHGITIVGWNGASDDPDGYWIIKNSWGTDWGDNGYMYIKYGCSNIGYGACYIYDYRGPLPTTPKIVGISKGEINTDIKYTFSSIHPEQENIYLFVDWNDGTDTGWIGPFESGEEVVLSYSWSEEGAYIIKAKAKNIDGVESDWGFLPVTMPKDKVLINNVLARLFYSNQFFQRLFEGLTVFLR